MKLGVNTFIWTADFDESHLPLLPEIARHGFHGVELPLFRPAELRKKAGALRKGLAENGLECTLCSVLTDGHNIISEDPAVRAKTRQHMAACVEAAAELGARIIAGPLYSPVGHLPGRRRTEDEWKWCVECYQELGPTLAAHDVTIAVEPLNRFETYFLNTAADAARLVDEIGHPNVGVLFDTFHANIEEKSIAESYRLLGKRLKHVHTCENDRGIPGTGHVDWPGVFAALRETGYDGWLTIESFGFMLGDLSAAAAIWRDIAPTPQSIAFDGVAFLRRMLAG